MQQYVKLFVYLKPYRKYLVLAFVFSLIFLGANILFMPLTRDIFEELGHKNLTHFNNQILNAIGLYCLRLIAEFSQFYTISYISQNMVRDIQLTLYAHYLSMSQPFFNRWKLGDLINRQFSDTGRVNEAIMKIFWELVPQSLTLIGIIVYLLVLEWQLTLVSIVAVPIFVWIIVQLGEKLKKISRQMQKRSSGITHIIQETLSNIKIVQAFTSESREIDKFDRETKRNLTASLQSVKIECRVQPIIRLLQFLIFAIVIWIGGYKVSIGAMTSPELAQFFAGLLLLIDPVNAVSKVYSVIQQSMASVERVEAMLDEHADIKTKENAITLVRNDAQLNGKTTQKIAGKIELRNITFAYTENAKPALKNVSFTMEPNTVTAIVGLSGAGKTSLINLIPRFYDVNDGAILVDGIDLRDLDLKSLRDSIGMVMQEGVLFRGSILENIRYGAPNATEDEAIEAAKQANAWEFIQLMKDGIHSNVGDMGRSLSGGQRQRVSIARAILRNPRILILDEATSALDSKSEQLVQDALDKLMKNRTTIVIAHRLSTIINSDKIIVLEKGTLIEEGPHSQLVQQNGRYSELYKLQFKKSGK